MSAFFDPAEAVAPSPSAPRRAVGRILAIVGDTADAMARGLVKPLLVRMFVGWRRRIAAWRIRSEFNAQFYAYCYPRHVAGHDPLTHYLTIGRRLGLDPSPDFSFQGYIEDYPDTANAADDPFYLHLRRGRAMGRVARPSTRKVGYFTAQAFDPAYYLATYPDVRRSGEDALAHYMAVGWKQARNPSADFSTQFYLDRYADARAAEVNPLFHYVTVGRAERRKARPFPAIVTPEQPEALAGDDRNALLLRLMRRQPEMATKWLSETYLTSAFNPTQRLSALMHNYRFLMEAAGPDMIHTMLFDDYEVWREAFGEETYRIVLKIADPAINEGELSLEFHSAVERLYVLSFTLIDGKLAGLPGGPAVLVSRLQGDGSKFEKIKAAAKTLKDVAPAYMLLAALQGLASAFGIERFAGVASTFQVSTHGIVNERFRAAYDNLFEALGVARTSPAFFTSALPLPEKPLSDVKKGHRLRTKTKRRIKRDVAAAVRRAVGRGLREPPADLPEPDAADEVDFDAEIEDRAAA